MAQSLTTGFFLFAVSIFMIRSVRCFQYRAGGLFKNGILPSSVVAVNSVKHSSTRTPFSGSSSASSESTSNNNEKNSVTFDSAAEKLKQQKLQNIIIDYQQQTNKRILDDTVKFPSKFIIKVIGNNEGDFVKDVLNAISRASTVPVSELEPSIKENGKFLSVTVNPMFPSANAVYATYSEVSKDKRVKFVL